MKDQLSNLLWAFLVAVLVDFIVSWPVMLAWNCVVPVLTKLPEIGYWQAFSVLFLAGVARATFRANT